jgi:type IV pilus assembly protein PilM
LFHGSALGFPRIIGLDVGTTAVKAAQIRRTGDHFAVVGLARAVIAGEPSAANRQEQVATAIQSCLRELDGTKAEVVCGLSGPDVVVRTFDLPALPRKQLASAVELEAAQICPFDIQEGAVAFQVLQGTVPKAEPKRNGDKAARVAGVLAAAKKDVITRLQDLCLRSNAHCVMMDVDGLALLNCLQACRTSPPGQAALVLNVGSAYTNLAILSDDGLPFVFDITCGGQDIVGQLCQSTGMDRKAIVTFLDGAEEKNSASEALQSGLKKACSPLAERVKDTMRYHVAKKSGPEMSKVLVCGGVARSQAFLKALGHLLERQVELWDPLASLSCVSAVSKSDLAPSGPQFAVALGLGMRSTQDVQD